MKALSLMLVALAGLSGAALMAVRAGGQDNLDYWLNQTSTASAPASQPVSTGGANPFAAQTADNFSRTDALPGAVLMSNGAVLPGGLYTTQGKDLEVWVEAEQRFRHVPLAAVLGIRAVVLNEEMEAEWRWKQMGSDERVYTGRSRPIRQINWRLTLVDGSTIEGEIKGQPIWIERGEKRTLQVLHSRTKGEYGQSLADLPYVRHLVISRRAMEEAAKAAPATRPAK